MRASRLIAFAWWRSKPSVDTPPTTPRPTAVPAPILRNSRRVVVAIVPGEWSTRAAGGGQVTLSPGERVLRRPRAALGRGGETAGRHHRAADPRRERRARAPRARPGRRAHQGAPLRAALMLPCRRRGRAPS